MDIIIRMDIMTMFEILFVLLKLLGRKIGNSFQNIRHERMDFKPIRACVGEGVTERNTTGEGGDRREMNLVTL